MKDELFDELLASVKEAGSISRGEAEASRTFEFPDPDVKLIRERCGLSQTKFARLIGVSAKTLQTWEQGQRSPTGPAKVLLKLVQADPDCMLKIQA